MKKIIMIPVLTATVLALFAFSPVTANAEYSNQNINRELVKEVSSFTEMYTRTYLSDQSVWAHRYKDYNLTSNSTNIDILESSISRN